MLIYAFCKSCEHGGEPEIVFAYSLELLFVLIFFEQFQVYNHVRTSYKTRK